MQTHTEAATVCTVYTQSRDPAWAPTSPTNIEFSLQNRDNLAPHSSQWGEEGRKGRKEPSLPLLWGSRGQGLTGTEKGRKAPSALRERGSE